MTEYDNRTVFREYSLYNKKYNGQYIQEKYGKLIALGQRDTDTSFQVSANTLAMIDTSIQNYKAGIVSDAIDLSAFRE